jgi:hypothetical protein
MNGKTHLATPDISPAIPATPATPAAATAAPPQPPTLTTTIQRVWADILELDEVAVGPHDDFFDLGGNSLIAPTAVTLLAERVGLALPLRALFEAPTPAEMAELIEEVRARLEPPPAPVDGVTPFHPEWLVPLQRAGAGRPVWLFPAGIGGARTLERDAQVAALVGRDRPFFGFRRDRPRLAPGRPDWMAATAASYMAQMRRIQGDGPFLIYAVCNGGPLAWETARQLLAAGEAVAGILFYEVALRRDLTEEEIANRNRRGAALRRMPHYDPPPLPVDLTLLMTEGWQARGRSDAWREVTLGELTTVVMPGDTPGAHNLYFDREPAIAGHLRDWIARAEARWSRP